MLKIHFMQQWFGLSDPAMEEALWETPLLRQFAGISLDFEGVPDETTILKFRHLLERHELSKALFDEMTSVLTERGLLLRQGTIVDATLIAAPPSTKNRTKSRDPEDEADQERQSVVFRHEGTYRRGCGIGLRAFGRNDLGQCA